jgi:hypothetical protein
MDTTTDGTPQAAALHVSTRNFRHYIYCVYSRALCHISHSKLAFVKLRQRQSQIWKQIKEEQTMQVMENDSVRMTGTTVIDQPTVSTGTAERLEDMYQVILHNDDHNTWIMSWNA